MSPPLRFRRAVGRAALFALGLLAATHVVAEAVRVGGTGSASALFQLVAGRFADVHPTDTVSVILPPIGSGGALRALRAGAIDLAVTARPPEAADAATLESRVLARTPVVLASMDGTRRHGFRIDELPALFSARIARWDDGQPIRVILRSASESDTRVLSQLSAEIAASLRESLAKPGTTVAEHDLDALELIEKTPGAVGVTTLGLINTRRSRVKPFAVDGISPSLSELANGRYRLAKPLYLIWSRPASPALKRLLDYLGSPTGQQLLREHAFLPENR